MGAKKCSEGFEQSAKETFRKVTNFYSPKPAPDAKPCDAIGNRCSNTKCSKIRGTPANTCPTCQGTEWVCIHRDEYIKIGVPLREPEKDPGAGGADIDRLTYCPSCHNTGEVKFTFHQADADSHKWQYHNDASEEWVAFDDEGCRALETHWQKFKGGFTDDGKVPNPDPELPGVRIGDQRYAIDVPPGQMSKRQVHPR